MIWWLFHFHASSSLPADWFASFISNSLSMALWPILVTASRSHGHVAACEAVWAAAGATHHYQTILSIFPDSTRRVLCPAQPALAQQRFPPQDSGPSTGPAATQFLSATCTQITYFICEYSHVFPFAHLCALKDAIFGFWPEIMKISTIMTILI